MIAFGPVPSRRLGRSLGINNIPPKVCTYSCVYCQVGKTTRMQVDRMPFYDPEAVCRDVRADLAKADWSFIEQLIRKKQLIKMKYKGHQFYMRVISQQRSSGGISPPER
jgi:wyosine [tRNA(Phe)-imidazoG37] synthetase (radical SAM superfamily)